MSSGIRTTRLLFLSVAIATVAGCAIHYHYTEKRRPGQRLEPDYGRGRSAGIPLGFFPFGEFHDEPQVFSPTAFLFSPRTIHVDLDEKSNVLYLKKIRVGQIKSGSS
jgi:hypothetical protein